MGSSNFEASSTLVKRVSSGACEKMDSFGKSKIAIIEAMYFFIDVLKIEIIVFNEQIWGKKILFLSIILLFE